MKEGTTEKPSESKLWRKEPDHASTRNAVVSKENEHLPHMNQTRTLEYVIELGEKKSSNGFTGDSSFSCVMHLHRH